MKGCLGPSDTCVSACVCVRVCGEGSAKRDKEIIFTPHFVPDKNARDLRLPRFPYQGVGNILSFFMFALIFSVGF